MRTIDDTTLHQWLDQDLDGELSPAEKAQLDERLATDGRWRSERDKLAALRTLLASDRVEVHTGFAARVQEGLPVAPWERPAPAWWLPAGLLAAFAAAAALVLGGAGALAPEGALAGTAVTLFDFLATSFLAGAGLLAASWRGVGMGLEELFAQSEVNLVAFGVAVVCLNLLFFRMLRRRQTTASPRSDTAEGSGR